MRQEILRRKKNKEIYDTRKGEIKCYIGVLPL